MAKKNEKYARMYLTNNSRRMAGLPLHRKKNAGRRHLTRCEGLETIDAFIHYCKS